MFQNSLKHPPNPHELTHCGFFVARVRKSLADVKAAHRNASFAGSNRVAFNIKGNNYRLIEAAHYNRGMMYARFVGTRAEAEVLLAGHPYDELDAGKV